MSLGRPEFPEPAGPSRAMGAARRALLGPGRAASARVHIPRLSLRVGRTTRRAADPTRPDPTAQRPEEDGFLSLRSPRCSDVERHPPIPAEAGRTPSALTPTAQPRGSIAAHIPGAIFPGAPPPPAWVSDPLTPPTQSPEPLPAPPSSGTADAHPQGRGLEPCGPVASTRHVPSCLGRRRRSWT